MRTLQLLPKNVTYDEMDSPVGTLTIIASPESLHAILWDSDPIITNLTRSSNNKIFLQTKQQLTEYFQGNRKIFNLPITFEGTPFQMETWKQLLNIPYATTISYSEQAARMGDKNKARAVGKANGLNPISIVIPCHRVIGHNGDLVGFGGGVEKKSFLLKLEQRCIAN